MIERGSPISLTGALFLLLVTLKLTGVIAWSWWWVTAPLWGFTAAMIVLLVVLAATAVIKIVRESARTR